MNKKTKTFDIDILEMLRKLTFYLWIFDETRKLSFFQLLSFYSSLISI